MTAKEYISGRFEYEFSDRNYASAFIKRGLLITALYEEATLKQLELIEADLYMVMVTVFSQGSQSKKQGNWSESDGGKQVGVYDRSRWEKIANNIYKKYGEYVSYSLKDATSRW